LLQIYSVICLTKIIKIERGLTIFEEKVGDILPIMYNGYSIKLLKD